jgi:hypothetical protein
MSETEAPQNWLDLIAELSRRPTVDEWNGLVAQCDRLRAECDRLRGLLDERECRVEAEPPPVPPSTPPKPPFPANALRHSPASR